MYGGEIKCGEVTRSEKLPPVLPIVLYNGERRWNAPIKLEDLIEVAPLPLRRYCPRLDYLLLDEGAYSNADLTPLKNLVALVFRLENSRSPADILQVVEQLVEWLSDDEQRVCEKIR